MARIDAKRNRSGSGWPWIIGLIILGVIVWGLVPWGGWWGSNNVATAPATIVTTPVRTPPLTNANDATANVANAPANIAPMPAPPTSADNTPIAVVTIINVPARFLGQPVAGIGKVAKVVSDRGFWLEQDGQRMFVVVAKSANMEAASTLHSGQHVRLAGVVYNGAMTSQITGGIEPDAKAILADQSAFLLVSAANIVPLQGAPSSAASTRSGT